MVCRSLSWTCRCLFSLTLLVSGCAVAMQENGIPGLVRQDVNVSLPDLSTSAIELFTKKPFCVLFAPGEYLFAEVSDGQSVDYVDIEGLNRWLKNQGPQLVGMSAPIKHIRCFSTQVGRTDYSLMPAETAEQMVMLVVSYVSFLTKHKNQLSKIGNILANEILPKQLQVCLLGVDGRAQLQKALFSWFELCVGQQQVAQHDQFWLAWLPTVLADNLDNDRERERLAYYLRWLRGNVESDEQAPLLGGKKSGCCTIL